MQVSVVMPVCNGEAFLAEALDSVLGQRHADLELIVVDDGSTDGSAELVHEYGRQDVRLRYFHQPNQGVTKARNNGIDAARGDLIAFLDQDDRWTESALQCQVACHSNDSGLGYTVAHQVCFMDPQLEQPAWFRLQRLHEPGVAWLPGTLVVKRAALERVGLFDPRYPISSDADWFARAKDLGVPCAVLPAAILERRIHQHNQSRFAGQIQAELLQLLHASVRRKRGNG